MPTMRPDVYRGPHVLRGLWCCLITAACGLVLLTGCLHKPFRQGSEVVDPALLALGNSDRSPPVDSREDVKYMFCMPDNAMFRAEVARIDPGLRFYNDARAKRICGPHGLVCVGSVFQTGLTTTLDRLSKKSYIKSVTLASLDFYQ